MSGDSSNMIWGQLKHDLDQVMSGDNSNMSGAKACGTRLGTSNQISDIHEGVYRSSVRTIDYKSAWRRRAVTYGSEWKLDMVTGQCKAAARGKLQHPCC